MKKALKTKVLAGTVTVALLSSAGFAFANTDAYGNLINWYDGQFKTTKESVNTQALNHAYGKVDGLKAEYQGIINGAKEDINGTRDEKIGEMSALINESKDAHVASVNNAKSDIEANMEAQFAGILSEGKSAIEFVSGEAYKYAFSDLTNKTGDVGNAAVEKVNFDINAVKGAAVDELEAAISNAKGDLTKQLGAASSATTEELKKAIDQAIIDLREDVTALVNKLVEDQQTIVKEAASDREEEAQKALKDLVDGI